MNKPTYIEEALERFDNDPDIYTVSWDEPLLLREPTRKLLTSELQGLGERIVYDLMKMEIDEYQGGNSITRKIIDRIRSLTRPDTFTKPE